MAGRAYTIWGEIGLKVDKFNAGLQQTKGKLGGFVSDVKKNWMAVAGATAVAGGAIYTLKKAYDFAKEGAQIELMRGRFDRLAISIGTTGEALGISLKEATRGMLSDAEAMQSATDVIGLGLVKTEDQAIRLVRVMSGLSMDMNQLVLTLANKTTMRFDQLGVAIDGFDVRVKKLQESGLSLDEAFTEAFLQQAEAQIEKVGDAADTNAGKIRKMESAFKNLGDQAKLTAASIFGEAYDAGSLLINWNENITKAYEDHLRVVLSLGLAYEDYTVEVLRSAVVTGKLTDYQAKQMAQMIKSGDVSGRNKQILEELSEAIQLVSEAEYDAAIIEARLGDERQESIGLLRAIKFRTNEVTDSTQELTSLQNALAAGLQGTYGNAWKAYDITLDDLTQQQAELLEQLREARRRYGDNSEEVLGLNKALEENKTKQKEAADALSLTTREMIYQAAAAGLDAGAALELARSMGLISDQDYVLTGLIGSLKDIYDASDGVVDRLIKSADASAAFNKEVLLITTAVASLQAKGLDVTAKNIYDEILILTGQTEDAKKAIDDLGTAAPGKIGQVSSTMDTAKTSAQNAAKEIGHVKDKINQLNNKTVTVTVKAVFSESYLKFLESHRQHGGPVISGKPYIVGEAGPEMFIPSTSGRIVPNNQLRSGNSGAGISIGEMNFFIEGGDADENAYAVYQKFTESVRAANNAGLSYAG